MSREISFRFSFPYIYKFESNNNPTKKPKTRDPWESLLYAQDRGKLSYVFV